MKNKMIVVGNIYCAGVYGMRTEDSEDYLYIGSSIEINDALGSRHLYSLKRGLYEDTNKEILQKYYDIGELVFEVIHTSESAETVRKMSKEQKESLMEALSVLEKFYIDMYKKTICNVQMFVTKHSSNKNKMSSYRRSISNRGSNNPNAKYDQRLIAEILWLKLNGYRPRDISGFYKDVPSSYISSIGITKWITLEPIKPDFIKDKEAVNESTGIDTNTASSLTADSVQTVRAAM